MKYVAVLLSMLIVSWPIASIAQLYEGETFLSPMVGGRIVSCGGTPMRITYQIGDVGDTVFTPVGPIIQMNPRYVPADPGEQIFIYAHECGHAALQTSNEDRADCFAAQLAALQGWLTQAELIALQTTFAPFGDWSHKPAQIRWDRVVQCYQDEKSTRARPTGCASTDPAGCINWKGVADG